MRKLKITTFKIEDLFYLMNWFKEPELIKYEYHLKNVEGNDVHVLYCTYGLMKDRKFKTRFENFSAIHKHNMTVEYLDITEFDRNVFRKFI